MKLAHHRSELGIPYFTHMSVLRVTRKLQKKLVFIHYFLDYLKLFIVRKESKRQCGSKTKGSCKKAIFVVAQSLSGREGLK